MAFSLAVPTSFRILRHSFFGPESFLVFVMLNYTFVSQHCLRQKESLKDFCVSKLYFSLFIFLSTYVIEKDTLLFELTYFLSEIVDIGFWCAGLHMEVSTFNTRETLAPRDLWNPEEPERTTGRDLPITNAYSNKRATMLGRYFLG